VDTQTEPDLEDKGCWTGEPIYKRYFIIRLFRPAEFNDKLMRAHIKFANIEFQSKWYELPKQQQKKPIQPQIDAKKTLKSVKPGSKNIKSLKKVNLKSNLISFEDSFVFIIFRRN
jgi:hypothetical protein